MKTLIIWLLTRTEWGTFRIIGNSKGTYVATFTLVTSVIFGAAGWASPPRGWALYHFGSPQMLLGAVIGIIFTAVFVVTLDC